MTNNHFVLFLIGVGLSIAQFVMIRDFVTILYGEEVVIVLVTAAFFLGLSLGYLLSLKLGHSTFRRLFVASLFLHLSLPVSYRFLAAWFSAMDAGGYAFLSLLFGYALLFTALFAMFLPRMVSLESEHGSELQRLRTYYSIELLGFVSGFVIIALTWNLRIIWLMSVYWLVLAILLHRLVRRHWLTVGYTAAALLAGIFLHTADYHSTSLIYRNKHYIGGAITRFSVNSPYQKVEVVDDNRGRRSLYLDGLQNLNTTDLRSLNYYIAELPARLLKPDHTLLIGNGTLSSVQRVYPHSGRVTSVELDPAVLKAGLLFFSDPSALNRLANWNLHVDDGKRYLRASREDYGLIIMDVPSPLTIQEGYLHTTEFYKLARMRLGETGVIAVQLSGPLQRNNRTPAQVTAALRRNFRDVMAIYSERADRGFAYASMDLPFNGDQLRRAAAGYESEIEIIEPGTIDEYLVEAEALSVNNMDVVLRRGLERFIDRYF